MKLTAAFNIFIFVCAFNISEGANIARNPIETIKGQILQSSPMTVSCESNRMCVYISRSWLKFKTSSDFNQLSLRLDCGFEQNSSHVTLCTDGGLMTSCGTAVEQVQAFVDAGRECYQPNNTNDTHIAYSNVVRIKNNESADGGNASDVGFPASNLLPWKCVYSSRIRVKTRFVPKISPVTQFVANLSAEGTFEAAMFLYKDHSYKSVYQYPPEVKMGDRLHVRVQLLFAPMLTRLQVVRCWGTPSLEIWKEFVLIDNFCPADSADVEVLANGDFDYVLWASSSFRFVESDQVFLHCDVKVCFPDLATCRKDCNKTETVHAGDGMLRNRRNYRQSSVVVSAGPIRPHRHVPLASDFSDLIDFRHGNNRGKNDGQEIFYSVISALSALCLVFVVTTIVTSVRRCRSKSFRLPPPSAGHDFSADRTSDQADTASATIDRNFHIPVDACD